MKITNVDLDKIYGIFDGKASELQANRIDTLFTSLQDFEVEEMSAMIEQFLRINLRIKNPMAYLSNGKVPDKMYYGADTVKELVVPNNITELGEKCFAYSSVEVIKFEGVVKRIPEGTFEGCKRLKKVVFKDGLVEISDNAFSGCANLTEIYIPSTLKKIGNGIAKTWASNKNLKLVFPNVNVAKGISFPISEKESWRVCVNPSGAAVYVESPKAQPKSSTEEPVEEPKGEPKDEPIAEPAENETEDTANKEVIGVK